ncbi:MAG: hypothetical protein CL688_02985 [Candidatus Puniceispirillum sp.]|nr:hypothetical protein [Candidatus Puniceispirillum sp.]
MTPVMVLESINHQGSPLMTNPDLFIHITHLDQVAIVTLKCAKKCNAINGAMSKRLEAPRGKVGFNGWKWQKQTHRLISTIYHMDKPVTAAVNGAAIFNHAEDR